MSLNFNPPEWLIQEYLKRQTPAEEASAGIGNALAEYAKFSQDKADRQLKLAEFKRKQEEFDLAKSKDAREGYESAVNFGNVSGLPANIREGLQNPLQGPADAAGVGPKEEPSIAAWRTFIGQNPQGVKGKEKPAVDPRFQQVPILIDGKPARFNPAIGQYEIAEVVQPGAPASAGAQPTMPIPSPSFTPRVPPNKTFVGTQDGKPILLDPSTGQMTTGTLPGAGPLTSTTQTEGQANAKLYADRMDEADAQLNELTQKVDLTSVGAGVQGMAPNIMKSENIQMVEQAKRNFLNAVLRRESGAVISPMESAEGNKQYFPVMGDSPAVLRQKALNRQTARAGLRNAAGGAPPPRASAGGNSDPLGIR